jgi:predicted signal transduction protein with EAL and GGDEF domain
MFTIMAKLSDTMADPEVQRLMQEVEALRLELKAMGQRLADAERLADRDVLTPLLNRRAFVREVQRAIALTRRHKTPASVIYFDMDGFKQINDRYGHAAGDAALIGVAEQLMAAVREADVVTGVSATALARTAGDLRRPGDGDAPDLGGAPDRRGGLRRTGPGRGGRGHVPAQAQRGLEQG